MFGFDHRTSRPVTSKISDMVEQGVMDKDNLIRDLLNWMSEDEVRQFARRCDYLPNAGDDEPEDDSEETVSQTP
jgi:ferritin